MKTNKIKPLEFVKKVYKHSSFKDKIETYLTNKEYDGTIRQYVLPRSMSDSSIQKEWKSTPIPVDVFASFIQKAIIIADKSKIYIFHVEIPGEVVAVSLSWYGDGWNSRAFRFGDDYDWYEGRVFLSSATALETSDISHIDPLNSLTLARAIEICKSNGLKVIEEK